MSGTPDFTIRPATLDDAEGIAACVNALCIADAGFPWTTEAQTRHWLSSPDHRPEDWSVAVDADGTIVGSTDLMAREPYVDMWALTCVLPAASGRGIGTALLRRSIARAEAAAAMASGDTDPMLRAWRWASNTRAADLFATQGFAESRVWFTLEIDLDDALDPGPVPDGIEIRGFITGRDERAMYETHLAAFEDHYGVGPVTYEQFDYAMFSDEGFDPDLLLLALDGAGVVGTYVSAPAKAEGPGVAVVDELGVLRGWRKRGIGTALLGHGFATLAAKGFHRAFLDVDTDNPTGALGLYQRAGMHTKAESVSYERHLR
ncbi:MAG: GNAT family N-acetyltransferase [Actinomycetota bacterium]